MLASNNSQKSVIICATNLAFEEFDCRKIINDISSKFNGKGGGKKNLSQAGCDKIDNLDSSLDIIKNLL